MVDMTEKSMEIETECLSFAGIATEPESWNAFATMNCILLIDGCMPIYMRVDHDSEMMA